MKTTGTFSSSNLQMCSEDKRSPQNGDCLHKAQKLIAAEEREGRHLACSIPWAGRGLLPGE